MIIIKENQKDLLNKYIPEYEEYDNIIDLLDRLDDVMLDSLVNEESGSETPSISKLYDALYSQN